MNRRSFLRLIGESVAAGLILPDAARDLIVPARTIMLPPIGGWPRSVTADALEYLMKYDLLFGQKFERGELGPFYDRELDGNGHTINIRVPARYRIA